MTYQSIPAPGPDAPGSAQLQVASRRFLVTGATGFIGSHVVARLVAEGNEVHAVTRRGGVRGRGCRWWQLDLADAAATQGVVAAVEPDVVIHLASQATGDRRMETIAPMVRDNLLSAVNVMSAVATAVPRARVVLAGSVEEPRSIEPGRSAVSPYAAAKAAGTTYATLFRDLWQLPVTVLRLAMVYGPGDPNHHRLLPHVARSLVDATAPQISSGRREIDWVYIDDVVDAFVAASTSSQAIGAVIDIGSGVPVTIRDTVERAVRVAGSDIPPNFGAVPDRAQERAHIADTGLARELLEWEPQVPLGEGLRRTIAYYRRPALASVAGLHFSS